MGGDSGPERPEKHLRRVFHGSQGLQNIYSQVLDVAVLARYYQWNVEASAPIHACGHGVDPPHFTKSVPFHPKAPIFGRREAEHGSSTKNSWTPFTVVKSHEWGRG